MISVVKNSVKKFIVPVAIILPFQVREGDLYSYGYNKKAKMNSLVLLTGEMFSFLVRINFVSLSKVIQMSLSEVNPFL